MIPRLVSSSVKNLKLVNNQIRIIHRNKAYYRSGAVKAMPDINSFGIIGVFGTVVAGLGVGAYISKHIAAFLEENDLFIPEDDDDDD